MIRAIQRFSGGRILSLQTFSLEQRCQANSLSTTAATTPIVQDSSSSNSFFKTSETNPNNLSERHLGRFYTISDDLYKKLYDHQRHHGFPVDFREQCKTFREQCIMVRKPFLDLKRCVDAVDLQKPVVRFVIYGNPGSGRSITLTSMVHYAYENEFIIVHFPWMPLWGKFNKELVPSTIRPGQFDHTIDAVTWLTKFKAQNAELVQKLNLVTEKEYQWSKRETTPSGSSILDIVDHGASRPAHATECMSVLCQELKDKSSQQKCKTMFLLDGINDLFYDHPNIVNPTISTRRAPVSLPMSKLTANAVLKGLLKADWSGGLILTVVDQCTSMMTPDSDFPRTLLGNEGWEIMDPFVPIRVTNYTSQEIQTTIDYYLERKWLCHPAAGTEAGRLELEYLSTRNPHTLLKLCSSR